jgi:hypothetical protein
MLHSYKLFYHHCENPTSYDGDLPQICEVLIFIPELIFDQNR